MGTWTHKQNQIVLLRDLLTNVLSSVRFVIHGYNAACRNLTAKVEIRSISASLLYELADLRRDEEVFVLYHAF